MSDDDITAEWNDPTLTVNGEDYDLSLLPDGATAEHPVLGTIDRTGDDYTVRILMPHVHEAPEERRFPVPITMITDGTVPFPDNTPPPIEEGEILEEPEPWEPVIDVQPDQEDL